MKTKLLFAGMIAFAIAANAQNSNPWPTSGTVEVGGNGTVTNPVNGLEIYKGSADHLSLLGTSPVIKFVDGPTNPIGVPPFNPWPMKWCRIALATGSMQFMHNAVSGDMIIQNLGHGAQPTGNGRSILFSTRIENANGVEHMRLNEWGNLAIGTNAAYDNHRLYVNNDARYSPFDQWATKSHIRQTTPVPDGAAYRSFTGVEGMASTPYTGQSQMFGVNGSGSGGFYNHGGNFTASGGLCIPGMATGVNYGVKAEATGNAFSYGIYASASGACIQSWAGYFVGDVYRTGWDNFSSDRKLKNDIQPLTGGLEKLMLLKPSTYTYRTEEFSRMNLPKGNQLGLIAQDLEEVFPELVTDMSEISEQDREGNKVVIIPEHKAVNYTSLIPLLVAGIQEQQQTISNLENQVISLEKALAEMSQRMGQTTPGLDNNIDMTGFSMYQNEPNPFTGETVIRYTLPAETGNASLVVYDLSGKQLATFPITAKGSGSVTITSENLAAGMYIYSIVADGKIMDSKRMVVAEK